MNALLGLLDAVQDPQFRSDVGRGLLGAANRGAVAGLLGGPVDLATMAMRPFGYSVQAPVMGSEWIGQKMEQAGMVPRQRNAIAEILAGVAVPGAAAKASPAVFAAEQALAPKASQMAQNAIENYMASNGLTLYAALRKPLGTGPHYSVNSLADYTPTLYRETSIDRATEFLPNSNSSPQTLWFSNEPDYALGQGPNRGVMMEFDANGIPGQLSLQKPMARQAYEGGNAEFVSRDLRPEQIGANLQTVRVSRDQQRGPYFRRVENLLRDWQQTRESDGTIVFTRK